MHALPRARRTGLQRRRPRGLAAGGGEELESPYVEHGVLDLGGWARDALALALPAQLVCRPDCAGLCPVCGVALADAGPDHAHERRPDPRWSKLSEIRFDA